MPSPITADQLSAVKEWLPEDAADNGWDDAEITTRWTGFISTTVRTYWFMRVSNTASYLDLPDPNGTLTITQIYRQAREMLDWWMLMIKTYGATTDPSDYAAKGTRIGKIKNRYPRPHNNFLPVGVDLRSPYDNVAD